MMVTTGGRVTAPTLAFFARDLPRSGSFANCSSKVMTSVLAPKWRAISLASSESSVWLTVANTPRASRRAIRSLARISNFSARSFTLMPSGIVMLRVMGNGSLDSDRARRRSKALHRAFLHSSRHIALSGPGRAAHRTACWRRGQPRLPAPAPAPNPGGRIPGAPGRVGCRAHGVRRAAWADGPCLGHQGRLGRLPVRDTGDGDAGRSACHARAARARRCSAGRRAWRRGIHGPRARLRDNESPLRHDGLVRNGCGLCCGWR